MYPNVHFLGGKLVTVREVDVTTKAHQRHEGSPYSPFETTPRRRFSTTNGRPWGGLQTFTNFPGWQITCRFLTGALLPPRSLQPPRVTRSRGECSRLAQITNCFGQKERGGVVVCLDEISLKNSHKSLWGLRFGVGDVRGSIFLF